MEINEIRILPMQKLKNIIESKLCQREYYNMKEYPRDKIVWDCATHSVCVCFIFDINCFITLTITIFNLLQVHF